MGSEPQFEIVCVFKGKRNHIYCMCHNKEPPGQSKRDRTEEEHKAHMADHTIVSVNLIFLKTFLAVTLGASCC